MTLQAQARSADCFIRTSARENDAPPSHPRFLLWVASFAQARVRYRVVVMAVSRYGFRLMRSQDLADVAQLAAT